MKLLALFLLVTTLLQYGTLVNGHGNMVKPMTWWDSNEVGWCWSETGANNHLGCGVLDLPENEFTDVTGKEPDCFEYWFSNGIEIPGERTLPEEMSQPEVTCINQAGAAGDGPNYIRYPWQAPGTAPSFSPCGTLGGAPNGCNNDGSGIFGECCSGNCDTFALGDYAENYEWPDMPITEWKLGSYQEVAWYVGANHAGGYSYRLCKMPEGGISEVTEECFQQTPLEFVGDDQWVEYNIDKNTGLRTELKALQTNVGTFPEGSMWRANPFLPHDEEGGSFDYGQGHIIDNIKVPSNLETGKYVVSHR